VLHESFSLGEKRGTPPVAQPQQSSTKFRRSTSFPVSSSKAPSRPQQRPSGPAHRQQAQGPQPTAPNVPSDLHILQYSQPGPSRTRTVDEAKYGRYRDPPNLFQESSTLSSSSDEQSTATSDAPSRRALSSGNPNSGNLGAPSLPHPFVTPARQPPSIASFRRSAVESSIYCNNNCHGIKLQQATCHASRLPCINTRKACHASHSSYIKRMGKAVHNRRARQAVPSARTTSSGSQCGSKVFFVPHKNFKTLPTHPLPFTMQQDTFDSRGALYNLVRVEGGFQAPCRKKCHSDKVLKNHVRSGCRCREAPPPPKKQEVVPDQVPHLVPDVVPEIEIVVPPSRVGQDRETHVLWDDTDQGIKGLFDSWDTPGLQQKWNLLTEDIIFAHPTGGGEIIQGLVTETYDRCHSRDYFSEQTRKKADSSLPNGGHRHCHQLVRVTTRPASHGNQSYRPGNKRDECHLHIDGLPLQGAQKKSKLGSLLE